MPSIGRNWNSSTWLTDGNLNGAIIMENSIVLKKLSMYLLADTAFLGILANEMHVQRMIST